MATMTVKNIPDDLYEQLKRRAAANRRSLNQEVIFLIESYLAEEDKYDTTMMEIRQLRDELGTYITDVVRSKDKDEARPDKQEIIKRAAKLRQLTAHYHLTNEELNKWKNEGRP